MTGKLPPWYPLANATDDEIVGWAQADCPPYDEMRRALPWLTTKAQLDGWLNAAQNFDPENIERLAALLPGLAQIPLPPKRRVNKEMQ